MSVYDARSLMIDGELVRELFVGGKRVYPNLPEGYTELEYIQSADSQYINTGVKVNPQYSVTAEFMMTTRATTWDTIFGTRNGSAARFTARYTNTATGNLGVHRSTSKTASYESYEDSKAAKAKVTDKFHLIRLAKNKYYFDGELRKTFTAGSSTTKYDYELFLFANNNVGKVGDEGYFRMRFCIIQDENNEPVRYFIPCKNQDGVAGMYDLIGGKFYGSSSSKAFTAGPVKEVN